MMNLSLAYVAGLFDGEGSIFIAEKHRRHQPPVSHIMTVTITNTNLKILRDIKAQFGGSVSGPQKPAHKQEKIFYGWRASSLIGRRFLEEIYPYLRIKSNAAWIAICFQEHIPKPGRHPISSSELALRDEARGVLRKINGRQRGVVSTNVDM